MFGYSRVVYEIFTFSEEPTQRLEPKIEVDTKLLRLRDVTAQQWSQLRQLQGRFTTSYLKWRYGSPKTYILLAFAEGELAHVEWVVPAQKIRSRYLFVTEDSYLIISCLTSPRFRGLGIYPAQLRKVVQSDIQAQIYWGLSACGNTPSLKGIHKAGGVKTGEFAQKRWLCGCLRSTKYYPDES